jgi:hypothetical protein
MKAVGRQGCVTDEAPVVRRVELGRGGYGTPCAGTALSMERDTMPAGRRGQPWLKWFLAVIAVLSALVVVVVAIALLAG